MRHQRHRKLFAPARGGPPYSGLGPACAEVCFMHDDQYEWRLLFYSRHSYVTQRMVVESPK